MSSPDSPENLAEMLYELSRKVDRLDARLAALETEAGSTSPDTHPEQTPPPGSAAPHSGPTNSSGPVSTVAPDPPSHFADQAPVWCPPSDSPVPSDDRAPDAATTLAREPRLTSASFEWLLGAKGLALAGMLIVVVGVGMFLKYAYDEGWLGSLSPLTRCAAAAGFGAIMLAAGEILRRRINPLASSGASATGIAIIYGSILAASRLYQLIDTPTTFALLVVITVLGVLLGSLSNRVMLALLSLLGAFLVPFMLESSEPSLAAMPSYLLSLLALGLTLAGWRGGAYAHVRRLAWWGTGAIGTLWIGTVYTAAPVNALVFVGLVWIATVAELVVSARFFKTLRDRTAWPDRSAAGFVRDDAGEIRFNAASLLAPEARWLNSAFGVTAWAVIAASLVLRQLDPAIDWLAPLGFGIASGATAAITLRLRRSPLVHLWAIDPSPRSALAAALVLNGALLLVATIAMALGGWAQVAAWGAIGLAAIETARRLRFRAAGVFGFALCAVAAARLGTLDLHTHMHADTFAQPLGLCLTAWSGQVLYMAAILAAGAWRSRYATERRAAATASFWLLGATLAHPDAAANSLGPAWLGLAAAAGWLTARVRMTPLRISAFALAAIGMAVTLFGQLAHDNGRPIPAAPDLDAVPMCLALLAWLAFAAIPRLAFEARSAFAALAIVSGSIAIASLYQTRGVPETLLAGVVYSGILLLISKRLFRWSVIESASAQLLVITAGWAANRVVLGVAAIEGPPVANVAFIVAIAATALWVLLAVRMRSMPVAEDAPPELPAFRLNVIMIALGAAWLLLLAATSLDVLRGVGSVLETRSAQGAALSIWWSLYAVASVALGFRLAAVLRWAGLALLGIVAAKVLLLDTQTLAPPARIVAAISVGLVIIGAGVLYARLMKKTADPGT